jgi:hypothetical protein
LGEGISRDPVGEEGGLLLYGFVGNNPGSFVDSDGRHLFAPPLGNSPVNAPVLFFFPRPSAEDQLINQANKSWDNLFNRYLNGSDQLYFKYGPDKPWTIAFRAEEEYQAHFEKVRNEARGFARRYCKGEKSILNVPQSAHYSLSDLSRSKNIEIFLEDMRRYFGFRPNRLKRLGSFRFYYTVTEVDCSKCQATVKFDAADSFNLYSNFRIGKVGLPKDPFGEFDKPFNSVYVHWYWYELLELNEQ